MVFCHLLVDNNFVYPLIVGYIAYIALLNIDHRIYSPTLDVVGSNHHRNVQVVRVGDPNWLVVYLPL